MTEKVDLNLADRATLATLPGIGDELAGRIIDYRETVRPFALEVELAHVPGISAKKVQEISDLVICTLPESPPVETYAEADVSRGVPAPSGNDKAAEETAPVIASVAPVAAHEPPLIIQSPAPARTPLAPLLLTAVLGALLGAALALGALWLLNDSLQLNDSAQLEDMQRQADRAAATAQFEQERLGSELYVLTTRAAMLTTREGRTAAALATAESDVATARASLADTMDEVAGLEAAAEGLDKRIAAVAASAENFDAFLGGMRNLLVDLQGTPTPQPAATRLTPQAAGTATITPTATRAATSTAAATRTPRPTATRIGGASPAATP